MRRLLISASLAYLLVAFGFILLTLLNASTEGELVIIAEADAGVIVTLCVLGFGVTILLALRILIDGKNRHDLERQVREPRKKSDMTARDTRPD